MIQLIQIQFNGELDVYIEITFNFVVIGVIEIPSDEYYYL